MSKNIEESTAAHRLEQDIGDFGAVFQYVRAESIASTTAIAGALAPLLVSSDAGVREQATVALSALSGLQALANKAGATAETIEAAIAAVDTVQTEAQAVAQSAINAMEETMAIVQKSAGTHNVTLPRPSSALLRHGDQAPFDSFHCSNSPDSVRSRIRFVYDTEGEAVGVAAILSEDPDSGLKYHVVNFDDHIPMADRVLRRRLDVDGSADGLFVYRSATQLAVNIADSIVRIYGPLDSMYVLHGRSESLATDNDSLGESLDGDTTDAGLDEAVDRAFRETGFSDDGDGDADADLDSEIDALLRSGESASSGPVTGLGETVLIADAEDGQGTDPDLGDAGDLAGDGLGALVGDGDTLAADLENVFGGLAAVDTTLSTDGDLQDGEVLLPEESDLGDPFADLETGDAGVAGDLAGILEAATTGDAPQTTDDDDTPAESFAEAGGFFPGDAESTAGVTAPAPVVSDDDTPAESFAEAGGFFPDDNDTGLSAESGDDDGSTEGFDHEAPGT